MFKTRTYISEIGGKQKLTRKDYLFQKQCLKTKKNTITKTMFNKKGFVITKTIF